MEKLLQSTLWAILFGLSFLIYLNVPAYYATIEQYTVSISIMMLFLAAGTVFYVLYGLKGPYPILFLFAYLVFCLLVAISHVLIFDSYSNMAWANFNKAYLYVLLFALTFIAAFRLGYDVRKLFVISALLASLLNIVDFLDQGSIFAQVEGFGVRAAGFYINANKAAEGILIAMLLGVGIVKNNLRVYFCYFCLLGVILTFSRSGIALWFLLFIGMMVTNVISLKKGILSLFIFTLLASLSFLYVVESTSTAVNWDALASRLSFFSGDIGEGVSKDSRFTLLKQSIDLFAENPFWGNGVNALLRDGANQLSHNQYLHTLSDFGLLGLLCYLVILYSVFILSESRKEIILFIIFVLLWGMFSHNILDSYVFFLTFSYLAVRKVFLKYEGVSE